MHFHQNFSFYSCAPTFDVATSKRLLWLVGLHQKFTFLCALSSKRLPLLVCAYTKTFALTHVRLDQNFCFYLCARTSIFFLCRLASKCLLLPVYNYIESLLSLYALSKLFILLVCAYIWCSFYPCAPISKVCLFFACLRQNVSFYACAPTVHQNFAFCVRFHQNVWFYPCGPTSKICFLSMHFHRNVSFYWCAPTSKCLLFPVCAYIKN